MKNQIKLVTGRKIRAGIVGCGRISKNHVAAIQANASDMEIIAVCDSSPDSAKRLADEVGVPAYGNLDEMLAKEDLDLVSLCTPSGLHAEQACTAAAYGVHVLTEKPMATRWEDGLNMVDVCEKAGVYLFVVKQLRWRSILQLLKRAVDDGRFGRIYLISTNLFWTRPQSYYDEAPWRGTWAMDGGALMNQASHYVDLLDWIFGPIKEVQAVTDTLGRNIECEDTAVLNLRWNSGALGSMNVTMLTYPENLESSITVLGENGTVRLGGKSGSVVECWKFSNDADYDASVMDQKQSAASHTDYYINVIQAIRGDCPPLTDGRGGLRSLEILTAAYRSAQSGQTIKFPLES